MRTRLESRVFRLWLSSLMNSDLTPVELRRLAEQLTRSPELFWEFGDLLQSVVERVDDRQHGTSKGRMDGEELADYFYNIIKNRRISKKIVFELLLTATRGQLQNDDSTSVRDALINFCSKASSKELDMFKHLIGGAPEQDEYLTGIAQRK